MRRPTSCCSRWTRYYQPDGLGSTVALTGSNGALIESYTYDAFGAATVRNASGQAVLQSTVGNRFLFTGREWLKESGLYDYRNRVYSAQLGRFLQTDPILFAAGDVNVYRYCGNNATNSTDPWGLLDPKGGLLYGPDDYQKGVQDISKGIQNETGAPKDKADKTANDIMEEMSLSEAKRLKDLSKDPEKNKDKIKKLLEEIEKRKKKKKCPEN